MWLANPEKPVEFFGTASELTIEYLRAPKNCRFLEMIPAQFSVLCCLNTSCDEMNQSELTVETP